MIEQLHLVRPMWLLALIPLAVLFALSLRKTRSSQSWKNVCDEQLLPHVLTQPGGARSRLINWLLFLAGALAILAAAGPAWEKLPTPVFRDQSALVIALDLSQSMNATDLKPSRLSRARLKLLDILKARKTGQTALVVYADDAFTVTPLTDDNDTIANLVPTLDAELMPAQGSNVVAAVKKSVELMQQAGSAEGHILLITDGMRPQDIDDITELLQGQYRLSIIGVGTAEGSPIPKSGGFLQDKTGAIVIAKMDENVLKQAAAAGGGRYRSITNDDSDINDLLALIDAAEVDMQAGQQDVTADVWREQGPWLLLLVVPIVALYARKGWLLSATLALTVFGAMQPRSASAIELDALWRTRDQQAMQAFEQGDSKTAAEKFQDPLWKATALYKQGEYEQAAKTLDSALQATPDAETDAPPVKRLSESDVLYNKANALAKMGQYQQAVETYDAALELDPDNEDAAYNKKLVEDLLKQQQQQNQQPNQNPQQDQQDNQQQQQSGGEQNQQQSQNNDQQQSDSQNQNSQNQQQQGQQQQNPSQQQQQDMQNQQQAGQNQDAQQDPSQQEQQQAQQQKAEQQSADEQQKQQAQAQEKQDSQPDDKAKQQQAQQQAKQQDAEQQQEKAAQLSDQAEQQSDAQAKVTERWLQRIPDDPGGLLRRKFYYQYNQREGRSRSSQPW